MMRVTGPDGVVYQFGPELWSDMNLPADHSRWAKSVRWSCGRPGFHMPDVRLWLEDGYQRSMVQDLVAQWAHAQFAATPPADFFKITGV